VESACKENLGCLQAVLESQNGYSRNEKYLKQIRGEYKQLINFKLFFITTILCLAISALVFWLISYDTR